MRAGTSWQCPPALRPRVPTIRRKWLRAAAEHGAAAGQSPSVAGAYSESAVRAGELVPPTFDPHARSNGSPEQSTVPTELRDDLSRARKELWESARRVQVAGVLTQRDVHSLRSLLKRARNPRTATINSTKAAAKACRHFADVLDARVAEIGGPGLDQTVDSAACVAPETLSPALRLDSTERGADSVTESKPGKQRPPSRRRHRSTLDSVPGVRKGVSTVVASPPRQPVRLDEIADEKGKLLEFTIKRQVVDLLDEGWSARQALEHLQMDSSRSKQRWAQQLYKRYQVTGTVADGRWSRIPAETAMVPEVKSLALQIWNRFPHAGPKNIHNLLREALEKRHGEAEKRGETVHLPLPAYPTLWEYFHKLPQALKDARGGDLRKWDKQMRQVIGFHEPDYANQEVQADNSRFTVIVRVEPEPGRWRPERAWVTASVDVFSRAVHGRFVATRNPDSWSISLALRHGILPKSDAERWPTCGRPELVVMDNGPDFASHAVKAMLGAIGCKVHYCRPGNPNEKPHVEAFFRTLKLRLREVPGCVLNEGNSMGSAQKRVMSLLTLPELRAAVDRFICEYHETVHSETGESPRVRWERTAHVHMVSEDDLSILMLKYDQIRVVSRYGIRMTLPHGGGGGKYRARELHDLSGRQVRIRYNPDDLLSILVYDADTDEFLCEAWLRGASDSRYKDEDVLADRRETRQRLVERTREQRKQYEREDRKRRQAVEAETRKAAAAAERLAAAARAHREAETAEGQRAAAEQARINDIMIRFRQHDRAS